MSDDVLAEAEAFLTEQSRKLLEGCQLAAHDGTRLYTPDGEGHYHALWTRDFAYMAEYAGDLIPPKDVVAGFEYLLKGVRDDGAAPDRVTVEGKAIYTAGPEDHPLGQENLDNPMFLVLLADQCRKRAPQLAKWDAWKSTLRRTLDWVPRSESGLVWNDPKKPHSPYGFTDTIAKTGELCMESLLYWRACRVMDEEAYLDRAKRIEKSITKLFDEKRGALLAATVDCRQIDVWANAFALSIGFPLGERRNLILSFLHDHLNDYIWRGQVRHLLKGEYWQRYLYEFPREQYQNGAYWATASGWILDAIAEKDRDRALQLVSDLINDFKANGICECVNANYHQLRNYVVSATNPLDSVRRLRREK
jgi:hypothetical protein